MQPALNDGDIVILRRRRWPPEVGTIIVAEHARLGRIIKRIDQDGRLRGDNPSSSSPAELGHVSESKVIGVAILAVTPTGIKRL